jgi:glutamine phosphoribosylpyrophosphate amidotransferase
VHCAHFGHRAIAVSDPEPAIRALQLSHRQRDEAVFSERKSSLVIGGMSAIDRYREGSIVTIRADAGVVNTEAAAVAQAFAAGLQAGHDQRDAGNSPRMSSGAVRTALW